MCTEKVSSTLKGLNETHPHYGQSALLSWQIQMLSTLNTLTDAPRTKFNQVSGGILWSNQHKMNPHNVPILFPENMVGNAKKYV